MLRFIAYHTGFTTTSLIVSVAIHGAAVLALVGVSSARSTSVSPVAEIETQIFEVAFGPLPETSPSEINPAEVSPELLNQIATPPEVVAKEIAIEKTTTKMVKKLVKQTDPINKNSNLDSVTGDNAKLLPTSNTDKPESDLPSTAISSSPQQLMNLSSWINRHRFYPSDARRKGEEGTVLMRISFSNTGHLENYQVIKSSGSNTLDRAAAEILKRSAPYPEELVAAFSQAEVPLVFSLRS